MFKISLALALSAAAFLAACASSPDRSLPEQSLIWSVSDMRGQVPVVLYGIVCRSIAEARDCAAFLEERGGLFFDEYDQPIPGTLSRAYGPPVTST